MRSISSGSGSPATVFGVPEHNPAPRTERGKRRWTKLNEAQRKQRESIWGTSPRRTWKDGRGKSWRKRPGTNA